MSEALSSEAFNSPLRRRRPGPDPFKRLCYACMRETDCNFQKSSCFSFSDASVKQNMAKFTVFFAMLTPLKHFAR